MQKQDLKVDTESGLINFTTLENSPDIHPDQQNELTQSTIQSQQQQQEQKQSTLSQINNDDVVAPVTSNQNFQEQVEKHLEQQLEFENQIQQAEFKSTMTRLQQQKELNQPSKLKDFQDGESSYRHSVLEIMSSRREPVQEVYVEKFSPLRSKIRNNTMTVMSFTRANSSLCMNNNNINNIIPTNYKYREDSPYKKPQVRHSEHSQKQIRNFQSFRSPQKKQSLKLQQIKYQEDDHDMYCHSTDRQQLSEKQQTQSEKKQYNSVIQEQHKEEENQQEKQNKKFVVEDEDDDDEQKKYMYDQQIEKNYDFCDSDNSSKNNNKKVLGSDIEHNEESDSVDEEEQKKQAQKLKQQLQKQFEDMQNNKISQVQEEDEEEEEEDEENVDDDCGDIDENENNNNINKSSIQQKMSDFNKTHNMINQHNNRMSHIKENNRNSSSLRNDQSSTNPTSQIQDRNYCYLQDFEGYLLKMSPSLFKGWQKRYFKLTEKSLCYYKTEKSQSQILGCINFDQVSISLEKQEKDGKIKYIKLQIKNSKRCFTFKQDPKSPNNMQSWYDVLQQHIDNSRGAVSILTQLTGCKKFWREKRISNYEFIHTANTGDILLFRGKSFGSKTQRCFSGAEYDHVAMILKKFGTFELILFESTGRDGVGLISWKGFTSHNFQNLYEKLVIRYLDYERTDEFLEKLDKFIKFALKKKYKFNLSKMLRKKSKPGEDSLDNQKRTYFCSELIGAAYKQVGLLPKEISSCQYWPGDFSAKKNLQLLKGATLSEENLIDFNLASGENQISEE